MTYILVILGILIVVSYGLFGNDLFSPSFLLFSGYFFSAIMAFYSSYVWKMTITRQQILILLLGWTSFFIAELLVWEVDKKNLIQSKKCRRKELQVLPIHTAKIGLVVVVDIGITLLLYKNVRSIAAMGGAVSKNIMASYKENAMEVSLSTSVTQLLKISKGMAFVFLYAFLNNWVADQTRTLKKVKRYGLYLAPCIIYCIQCFLKGGRFTVIAFLLGGLFMYFFFLQYKTNWKYKMKLSTIIKLIVLSMIVVYVFWAIKELVGRTSQDTILDYIARYLGGSYELLSLYLKNPPEKKFETFGYMIQSVNKLFGSSIPVTTYQEFRFSDSGIMIGNVYTGMRNYYNDFSYIGVISMSFLLSLIYNLMYKKMRNSLNAYKNEFLILFYSSQIYAIIFHFFTEYFFARWSIGYIVELMVMYACYKFILKIRFTFGN